MILHLQPLDKSVRDALCQISHHASPKYSSIVDRSDGAVIPPNSATPLFHIPKLIKLHTSCSIFIFYLFILLPTLEFSSCY